MAKFIQLQAVFFVVTFLSLSLSAQNRNGIIQGHVLTSDGRPAAGVSIQVLRTSRGAVSDEKGSFRITGVRPGSYTIKVSAISSFAQEKTIAISAGQILQVDFQLEITASDLTEVVVSNRRLDRENSIVAKIPLKNIENPQVYNTVGSELMKQQNITSFDDALRNVPNLSRTWESTGRAGDGGAYFSLRGFDAQSALTNGLPTLASGNVDPANIEEIQVLKGPSGTLFGGSFYSYGGLINTITKKPYFHTGGEFSYQFGSFGLNRFTADINTPLSKKEKIALRVNAAYHSENSFQDAGFKKSFFVAPSLTYQVNDRLSFQLMSEFLEEERAVAPVFFNSDRESLLDFKNIAELNLDPKLSFISNDITIRNPRFNFQGQMFYKLSGKWIAQTAFSRGTVRSNGIYSYIWDDVAGDEWFSQWFHDENQQTNSTDIQQNFNGDFTIGGLRNRVVLGVDYYHTNVIESGSGWGWGRNVTPRGDVNYIDPFSGDEMEPTYLTRASVDKLLAPLEPAASNIGNSNFAAYASDVLNVTPNLMVMVSLRADYFDSKGEISTDEDDFDQWALSPKLGLVYQVVPGRVSLFGNYMNAFINVAPMTVADPDGSNSRVKSFKPEQANQWEAGVKASLFQEKLLATFSYYDIKVSDRVTGIAGNPFDYTQGGKVGSKGFEIDIKAIPTNGLSLLAGFSHGKTKVLSGNGSDFYAEEGRVIGGQGPSTLANVWANYTIPGGKAKGLGFGIGGNYAGEYLVIDNSQTGQFYPPSYTLLNAAVSYSISNFRFGLNGNNLLDKQYYIGYWSVNPQKKINFTASVAYKF
jgi:iron complex outermembrane receptor protein